MIMILGTIDPNFHSIHYWISALGVEGKTVVLEHSNFPKAIRAFLAKRPQHRELHAYMAAVWSQLKPPLPVSVHQGLSCGSIHQCKCLAALVIGQIPDGAGVLDPVLFICNRGNKRINKKKKVIITHTYGNIICCWCGNLRSET